MSPRSIPLRLKLVAALVFPMIIVVALIGVRIDDSADRRETATRQADEVARLRAVSAVADALGAESVAVSDRTTTADDLSRARAATDAAIEDIRADELGLPGLTRRTVLASAAELTELRATMGDDPERIRATYDLETWQADAPGEEGADPSTEAGTVSAALRRLNVLPTEVLGGFEVSASAITDVETARLLRDHDLVRRLSGDQFVELSALLRLSGTPTLIIDDGVVDSVLAALRATDTSRDLVDDLGSDELASALVALGETDLAERYATFRRSAASTTAGVNPLAEATGLNATGAAVAAEYDAIADEVLESVSRQADSTVSDATRDLVLWALVGLWVVVVAGLTLRILYRAIKSPLERLTERSQQIANVELPGVVAAMRRGDIDEMPEVVEIESESNDEIGALVEAFNDMHRTAVQLAAEQAGSRRVVADMFVNLGRRNQRLVNRLLRRLTAIEQDESDPDKLAALYEIDHVATRMRRNAESLLVLAGAGQSRSWDHPVEMYDIARAALSEVEGYDRVRIEVDDVEIHGDLVADLTHLLAELVENALSFSPPSTEVHLGADASGDGHVVVVSDQGLGMTDEQVAEANERIERASDQAETPSEFLGHYVIGRLAARHSIRVELGRGELGGVVARVVLPVGSVVPTASQLVAAFDTTPAAPSTPDAPAVPLAAVPPAAVAPATPPPPDAPCAPRPEAPPAAPSAPEPVVESPPVVAEPQPQPDPESEPSPVAADPVPAGPTPIARTVEEQPPRPRLEPAATEFPSAPSLGSIAAGPSPVPSPSPTPSPSSPSLSPSSPSLSLSSSPVVEAPAAEAPMSPAEASWPTLPGTSDAPDAPDASASADPGVTDLVPSPSQDDPLSVFAASRRTPGANLPDTGVIASLTGSMRLDAVSEPGADATQPDIDRPEGDPDAIRFHLSGFQSGIARAEREERP
ncbi:ATP-binding protein [Ilumatobacter sp.]|uniref:ATP-binding protein n=1 Tax=Ilumatobacter sp. TaxID=1967498 RepID=UPI003B52EF2A